MSDTTPLKGAIEALLFVSDEPVSAARLVVDGLRVGSRLVVVRRAPDRHPLAAVLDEAPRHLGQLFVTESEELFGTVLTRVDEVRLHCHIVFEGR